MDVSSTSSQFNSVFLSGSQADFPSVNRRYHYDRCHHQSQSLRNHWSGPFLPKFRPGIGRNRSLVIRYDKIEIIPSYIHAYIIAIGISSTSLSVPHFRKGKLDSYSVHKQVIPLLFETLHKVYLLISSIMMTTMSISIITMATYSLLFLSPFRALCAQQS